MKILATRAPAAGDLPRDRGDHQDHHRSGAHRDEGEKIGYIASRLATMERPADKYP